MAAVDLCAHRARTQVWLSEVEGMAHAQEAGMPVAPQGARQDASLTAAERPHGTGAFGAREWAVVAIAIAEALLWVFVFDPWAALSCGVLVPGVGVTLFALVGFAAAYALCWGRLVVNPGTVLLNAWVLLLALSFALFANQDLRMVNALALWAVGTYTLFATCGLAGGAWATLRAFGSAGARFFSQVFDNIGVSFKVPGQLAGAIAALRSGRTRHMASGLLPGIVVACVLMAAVMPPSLGTRAGGSPRSFPRRMSHGRRVS